jgi:hypothetical protein
MIPEELIDALREHADIVELVSSYIPLKRVGKSLNGSCPFHKEKTPSFSVSPEKKIPAFKDLPEKFVKGLHKPIVSEAEYWTAQKMLSQKRPMKVRADEEFPLRGVLKCMCGSPFTAGWSKGAKEYYLYYRCVKHSNINIPGLRLHEEFNRILKALSFQP